MSQYKVLFLDMDGTIIGPDGTIEESTKQAILTVQKKGLDVFLATGRPTHEIQEIAKELNIKSFIGYNGSHGVFNGEELFIQPMEPEIVNRFLRIAKKYHHELVLYTNSNNTFTSLESIKVKEFIQQFHLSKNELYSPQVHTSILGITVINAEENDYRFYEEDSGIHLSQINIEGMQHCYDVIQNKINKGIGVINVLKHLGANKESAIAFGDGMNDKEMLMNVGEGIAMGNAQPELLTYAKHQTTDVTDSGVWNGLKMLGLIEKN